MASSGRRICIHVHVLEVHVSSTVFMLIKRKILLAQKNSRSRTFHDGMCDDFYQFFCLHSIRVGSYGSLVFHWLFKFHMIMISYNNIYGAIDNLPEKRTFFQYFFPCVVLHVD